MCIAALVHVHCSSELGWAGLECMHGDALIQHLTTPTLLPPLPSYHPSCASMASLLLDTSPVASPCPQCLSHPSEQSLMSLQKGS